MPYPSPPKFSVRFFKWFCDPSLHPLIEGDLMELYQEKVGVLGRHKADIHFIKEVVRLFRPGIIRSNLLTQNLENQSSMFNNYLKVAWRNLLKHKLYSTINLLGLTIGMACFILITLYLQYELSYDTHHEKSERIFRLIQQQKGNVFRGTDFFAVSPEPLAKAMKETFPEVEFAATVNDPRYASETIGLAYEDKVFSPRILYADERVFDVFTIPMIAGEGRKAIGDPNSILLSESLAKKYFGNDPAIGKVLIFNKERPLTVKGIFQDGPSNQHLAFDYLVSFQNYEHYEGNIGRWDSNNFRTYVVLSDKEDYHSVSQKLKTFDKTIEAAYSGLPFKAEFFLQPIEDIHLFSNANFESSPTSDIRYVYLFISIAFIILLLAAINYMNLATARSINRSKEVGMRKVMGAKRGQLVAQFLGEAFY